MRLDLGDAVLEVRLNIKGKRLRAIFKIGAPRESRLDERVDNGNSAPSSNGRIDVVMDLLADKAVDLDVEWTDEMGNPTAPPPSPSMTFTVDNSAIINLTDNGDGTAVAAAVGVLGTANVHLVATATGMPEITGDLAINVVAGLAERANIRAGEPREVIPDI